MFKCLHKFTVKQFLGFLCDNCINKALCFVTLDWAVLLCGVVSYFIKILFAVLDRVRSVIFLRCLGVCLTKEKRSTQPGEGLVKLNFLCPPLHAVEAMCGMMTINEMHKRV